MSGTPWVPPSLRRRKDVSSLAYVVVDEIESGLAGLTVTPWPTLDRWGRLHFDLAHSRLVGVRASLLLTFLGKHRTPRRVARRPLRMGDVFAVRIREPLPPEGELGEPASWMVPPITDLSSDAREAAKLAFFSAVAPTLNPETDSEIIALAPKSQVTQTGSRPRSRRPRPSARG